MNIVLYKGNFNYDVVNYFIDELSKVFQNRGYNVDIVDLRNIQKVNIDAKSDIQGIRELHINKATDLVLAFNGIGALKDNLIYDKLGIIYGALLVDHPLHHYRRVKEINASKTFFGVLDEGSMLTSEKYIKEDTIYTHLMHGGSFAKNRNCKKVYDVVVMGGLHKEYLEFDKMIKTFKNNDIFKTIATNLYEKANKDYCKTLDEYLEEILGSMNIPDEILNMDEFKEAVAFVYRVTDIRLRSQIRYNAVLNLIKNKIEVHHFGICDSEELKSYNNFISHGSFEYEEILEVMAKSKVLVHDIGYFKNGSHERVFSAMLNGTLVISNTNNYSFNMYKDGESIVFYDTNNNNELIEKVKYYLENEEERNMIVNNAYNITNKYNTWENRADDIIRTYDIIKSAL